MSKKIKLTEEQIAILDNPENEFVTVSLGEWLTLEEKNDECT